VAERDIARYARGRAFPLIPCRLCGSQDNLQRVAVKRMLTAWEREFPGRTESIASALRRVALEHLADSRHFDVAGLDARRAAPMSERDEEELLDTFGPLGPPREGATAVLDECASNLP
jgi:tRNA 2-thiocytidine biosynthesis protein TtcA